MTFVKMYNLKDYIIKEIMPKWLDPWGRMCLKPAKESLHTPGAWDSENQLLWTGELALLIDKHGPTDTSIMGMLGAGINSCQIMKGLYSRHPWKPGEERTFRDVSHDEYKGLIYYSAATGNKRIAEQICDYGRSCDWAFIDRDPGASAYKDIKEYASRIRQPKDRALYKLAAGRTVKWYEVIDLTMSHVLTATRDKSETSGKVMAFFNNMAIQKLNYGHMTSLQKKFYKLGHKFYEYRMKKQYGAYPIARITEIYFNVNATGGKINPIRHLCYFL